MVYRKRSSLLHRLVRSHIPSCCVCPLTATSSYYKYLAPMTPITPPDFRSPASHPRLLQEEPMLTVVLLTVSSRYSKLAGPGDMSRSFLVHERLWTYLQNMISRMFWGQEQFGGGFCGAGSPRKYSSTAFKDTLKTGSLGSIGSIERCVSFQKFRPKAYIS